MHNIDETLICARAAALVLLIESKPFQLELDELSKSTSVNIFWPVEMLVFIPSTSVFCTYPTPAFRHRSGLCLRWPLFDQQVLEGWASTTETVSPYSYYLALAQLSETEHSELSKRLLLQTFMLVSRKQTLVLWEGVMHSINLPACKHTPEHIPPGNRNIWAFSPGWIDTKSFSE